jgi:hypothetical protein
MGSALLANGQNGVAKTAVRLAFVDSSSFRSIGFKDFGSISLLTLRECRLAPESPLRLVKPSKCLQIAVERDKCGRGRHGR